jgi:hypothetical protein
MRQPSSQRRLRREICSFSRRDFVRPPAHPGLRSGNAPALRYRPTVPILHLMGVDHKRLIFNFQGRDFRRTDVYGRVVSDILA